MGEVPGAVETRGEFSVSGDLTVWEVSHQTLMEEEWGQNGYAAQERVCFGREEGSLPTVAGGRHAWAQGG